MQNLEKTKPFFRFKYQLLPQNKLKQEMLPILTIVVRQIVRAFSLALKNTQILIFSRITLKKGVKLAIILGFLRFVSGSKTSKLYLRFIIRECKENLFSSSF